VLDLRHLFREKVCLQLRSCKCSNKWLFSWNVGRSRTVWNI